MMCNYDTQWSSTMAHGSCKVLIHFSHSSLLGFSGLALLNFGTGICKWWPSLAKRNSSCPGYRLSLARQNVWVIHTQSKEYDKWGTVPLGRERCSCPAPGNAAQWSHSFQLSGLLILSALPAKGRQTQEDELLIFTCCWLGSRFAAYFQAPLLTLMVINTCIHSI